MDMHRFGQAYSPLPEKVTPQNAARRELVDAPRKWMRFFDETMDTYLQDKPLPEKNFFYNTLLEYYEWNKLSLQHTVRQLEKIEDPSTPHNVVSTELTFHRLNGPMAELWNYTLYTHDTPLSDDFLKQAQLSLAIRNGGVMRQLVRLQSSKATRETQPHKTAKGIMSEVDMAITGLEIMKQHPGVTILPAPARYESNTQYIHQNVDFLLLDTTAKQAHGIQMKTNTVRGAGVGRNYDTNLVTVVDGANELGNSTQFQHNQAGSMSLPGQIAMGILAEQSTKHTPWFQTRADFLSNRQIAKEIMKGRRNYLGEAAVTLSHRLLHDLYKNPDEAPSTQSVN